MNSRLSLQQFKGLFFVQSLFVLLLVATGRASANTIDIKDTNYPIPGGAYFVSTDGKDTNSGKTPGSPWPFKKAFASAPSGAVIVFRGGTYRNIDGRLIDKKLTLQPYPHEKVWIKGSIDVEGWVQDGAIWRKDGWTYSFPPNGSSENIDPAYPLAGYRDMVYINGLNLKQVASKAEVGPAKFYVDSTNKQLYIGDNPAGKKVEATTKKQAFYLLKYDTYDPSNTIIRGLGFAHYADEAIAFGAPRVTLENNTFVWNGVQGILLWGQGSGGQWGVTTDAIVRGNTFSYNGSQGVAADQAHRMLLEDNKISYNNVEHFSKISGAAGIKAIKTKGLIWRNNLVENNFATGMWMDISNTNATIVRNVVRNNENMGIFMEISHKAIIAANVVYKNSTGIMVTGSSSAQVYNNTLSKNGRNIVINDDTRVNTNAAEIALGSTWIARNNIVKNNILSNTTGSKALFDASNWGTKEPSSLMIDALDYNAYYRTVSSALPFVIRWSLGGDGWSNQHNANNWDVGYPTVAAFNATGYEAHALTIDNVATNPFFVDEANGDYRLKSGSPAIGRGGPLPADVAQAIGLPAGVRVDLGALQATVY